MIKLSNERIEQILHEETVKKEKSATILRGIYNRYMRLYEDYFADIDALNDDKIAEFRNYHEETRSLIKYYYMDIPQDTCTGIKEFEKEYSANLLGSEWHEYLFRAYEDFKKESKARNKNEEYYKAEFTRRVLEYFYEAMDYVFREGFGTGSKTTDNIISGLAGLFFGKQVK